MAVKSESFKTLITGMLSMKNRWTLEEIINSEWFNGDLPTKDELISDMSARKKIVDNNKKKNDDEKLKTKSGGSQGKVYRGDGEEVDIEQINEMFKSLDFENYKEKTIESIDTGKLSLLKFKGDKENPQKKCRDFKKPLYKFES